MWKWQVLALCLLAVHPPAAVAREKILVIANKELDLKALTRTQMKSLFLGEMRFTASGKAVRIGDRDRSSRVHKDFYESTAQMSPKDVSIYWARKVFSGQALPPARIPGDDKSTLDWVRAHTDGISYIYADNVDSSVQVVGDVPLLP